MEQTVLITGASRGIGAQIADAFAKARYNCILICNNNIENLREKAIDLSREYKIKCEAYQCDVSDYSAVEELFNKIGSVDVLINNAGISYIGLLSDMSIDMWDKVINTNLNSAFYMSKKVIPGMLAKRAGCIINISSVWGECGASMEVAYSASKGGLNAFTKALAKELALSGISVNAISCGIIDTSMNSQLSVEEKESIIDQIPIGRMGDAREIGEIALSLANSPAYLTGQIIRVDGGWT